MEQNLQPSLPPPGKRIVARILGLVHQLASASEEETPRLEADLAKAVEALLDTR